MIPCQSEWNRCGECPRQGLGKRAHLASVWSQHSFESSPTHVSSSTQNGQHQRGAQDGGLSACPFTNTTRPIAARRSHRPLVLLSSTAFREARLSRFAIRRRSFSLAAYARVRRSCKTYARQVSIRLPDPLFAIDSRVKSFTRLAVIICCSLTALRHLDTT